jgi:hypothetical protein
MCSIPELDATDNNKQTQTLSLLWFVSHRLTCVISDVTLLRSGETLKRWGLLEND